MVEEAATIRGLEATSDRADRLLALEDLRDMGLLSQRDYVQKTRVFALRSVADREAAS